MKKLTKLHQLLLGTNTLDREVIKQTKIEKSYFSKLKNERDLNLGMRVFYVIKTFFIQKKLDELITFFACPKHLVEETFERFFEADQLVLKPSKEPLLMSFDAHFNPQTISTEELTNLTQAIQQVSSTLIFVAYENYETYSYFLFNFAHLILSGQLKLSFVTGVTHSVVFQKEVLIMSIMTYQKKSIISQKTPNKRESDFYQNWFNELNQAEFKHYKRLNYYGLVNQNQTISGSLASEDQPCFFVTHPHFSCMSELSLNPILPSIPSKRLDDINQIIQSKMKKHHLEVISSVNQMKEIKDYYIAHGLSIFLDQEIKMNYAGYQAYLKDLKLSYQNEYLNFTLIQSKLPINVTVYQKLLIIYQDYQSVNYCLLVNNPHLIKSIKASLSNLIKQEALSRKKTLEFLDELIKAHEIQRFDQNKIY